MGKKYLVFGAAGLLGEAFTRILRKKGGEVLSMTRVDLDLSDLERLEQFLTNSHYDVLVNCSGMTGLEQCLDHPESAYRLNVEVPAMMAKACHKHGAKMVHFSTDYVFGGEQEGWVQETDIARPVSLYGETKLKGEREVESAAPSSIIARVSWLFGRGKKTFVDQVLIQAQEAGWPEKYIADKYSVPNYADDLVFTCLQIVDLNLSGVVHLCSKGPQVSWHKYAQVIMSSAQDLGLLPQDIELPLEGRLKDVSAFRACRPRWTAMRSIRLEEAGLFRPDWRDGLSRYLQTLKLL